MDLKLIVTYLMFCPGGWLADSSWAHFTRVCGSHASEDELGWAADRRHNIPPATVHLLPECKCSH